ncbi:uncharacterized protein LOC135694544 isoform X1 [Rhopilema esculentum]|uniref:uncharacterized protein LOC135694544 isoform X1 n=2 Tax=Rhopilema esculentum TaxID=499914 RepID=UPI0031CFC56D
MDKPATPKKKSSKIVRKFFRWKADKSKSTEHKRDKHSSKTQCSQPFTDTDEDSWERIRNMEQARQISAMQNHIANLQSKLESFDNHNNNTGTSDAQGDPSIKTDVTENFALKSEQVTKDSVMVERKRELSLPEDDSQDSGEEIFVYVDEDESNPKEGSSREFNSSSELPCTIIKNTDSNGTELNDSTNSVKYSTKKVTFDDEAIEKKPNNQEINFEDITDDVCQLDQIALSNNFEDTFVGAQDTFEDKTEEEILAAAAEVDSSEKGRGEFMSDQMGNKGETRSFESLSSGSNAASVIGVTLEDAAVDRWTDVMHSPEECAEANVALRDDNPDLTKINGELKDRIAELEEQVWLAAEDKRNMQAMLEIQKERALKNLAFKFQDINKKTLRELKSIFEYRLQELNEEKVKLQERLENHKCDVAQAAEECQICVTLEESVQVTNEKCSKLAEENIVLRKRCRKLSGDLGKVKKAIGALQVAEEHLVNERGTQTENLAVEVRDMGIQCQESLETSIYVLHDDVKAIAAGMTSLSNHILNEQKQWVDNSSNQSLAGDSPFPTINEDSGNESSRLCASKSRSEHDESELEDDSNLSCSENSCDSDKSGELRTEGSKDSSRIIDDVDSGFFCSDISECEIEKHLDKIHQKYIKISEELEDYERSKLQRDHLQYKADQLTIPSKMFELDPEIMKIVEDVNRQYDEYFRNKVVL